MSAPWYKRASRRDGLKPDLDHVSRDDTTSRPEPTQRRPFAAPRRRLGIAGGPQPAASDMLASEPAADATLFFAEGASRYDAGDFEGAVSAYSRALAIDPGVVEAWNNLGNACVRLGRFYDAIAAYERALAIREDVFECWFNLGTAYADIGSCDDALRCLERALALKPDAYDVWYNLGFAYAERGSWRPRPKPTATRPASIRMTTRSGTTWGMPASISRA